MYQVMSQQHEASGDPPFEGKTVPQGAATSLRAGVVADADAVGGRYGEDCRAAAAPPDDALVSPPAGGVNAYAIDIVHAEA